MARDRNVYVWQAYVTVMSIVSLACLGAMMFVIFQSGTNAKTVELALGKERTASDELRKAANARQVLERIVGVGTPITESEFSQLLGSVSGDEKLNAAVKVYTQNMALFGPGASEPSYTKLVATLMQELRARNMQVDAASKREIELKDKYDATIAQETKARDAEKQKAQDLANQLEKELTKYTDNINQQQQTITKIETEKQALVQSLTKKIKDKTSEVDKLSSTNEDLQKRIEKLNRKLQEIQGEDFQYAQGKITNVTDGGRTVYINLGSADRLKPGVTFGVLDADITKVSGVTPKAKIEVVKVINERLSSAKVLADRAATTILQGDQIYSPGWQAGKDVLYALVGKMDIDGDSIDDRDSLKALIEQNGGKVTAELLPNGELKGSLSVDTNWLVIGEDFQVKGTELDNATTSVAKKRSDLEQQAKALNIGRMNLDKLMSYLKGGKGGDVLPIGTALRSKAEDYRKSSEGFDNPGRVSELFQTRDGGLNRTAPKP